MHPARATTPLAVSESAVLFALIVACLFSFKFARYYVQIPLFSDSAHCSSKFLRRRMELTDKGIDVFFYVSPYEGYRSTRLNTLILTIRRDGYRPVAS